MTAEQFARLIKARRMGPGTFQGHCPTHTDRSPSLSIKEGCDGRVLVHCHAGCKTEDILRSLGLTFRDLHSGPDDAERPDVEGSAPASGSSSNKYRSAHENAMSAAEDFYRAEARVEALGKELANTEDDDPGGTALKMDFDRWLDILRQSEANFDYWHQLACRLKRSRR